MPTGDENAGAVQEAPAGPVEPEATQVTVPAVETAPETQEKADVPKTESALESARKAFEDKEDGDKGEEAKAEEKPAAVDTDKVAPPAAPTDEDDYRPPNRLSAKEKELYNKLPKELRPSIARMFKEHEANFTRAQLAAKQVVEENRSMAEAIRPYVTEWNERGLSAPAAIAGLAASHKKLTNEDPQVRLKKWAEIGLDIGIDSQKLSQFLGEGVVQKPAPQDISQHPQYLSLRNEIDSLKGWKQSQDAAPVIAEGLAVAEEKDAAGRFLWPELHDDNIVSQRVRPLVSALIETTENLKYGEALKRAVRILRGEPPLSDPNQLIQTRSTNGNTPNRAQTAAVSVRGRSAIASNGSSMPEVPRTESARDSARIAFGIK